MITQLLRWTVLVLGSLAILGTLLPFLPGNERWIRVWDFPRIQLAVVLAAGLLATPLVMSLRRRAALVFMTLLAGTLSWQLYRVLPYTPVYSAEAKSVTTCRQGFEVRLLVANVLIENRRADPLFALVREIKPDVILLVETDSWWEQQLEVLRVEYPHVIGRAQSDSYGMHLFSRFPMINPELRFLLDDYVPSIRTGLRLPSGVLVYLYGLHPKPPPLEDTERRDAELLIAGREVRHRTAPAIVAGDLNDVAWSRTTRLFQEVSGLLDPRIGRSPYATFNANWPLLRWPLDHVFFDKSFRLLEVRVLPHIGSDHYPFFVALCFDPSAEQIQTGPGPEPSDIDAAEEAIREGKQESQK